jgi:hypothetical protein
VTDAAEPTVDAEVAPSRAPRVWRAWQVGLLGGLVVGFPLVVAAVVLHGRHYFPVLDLAMTEFRVRDVFGSHTPLIGLPGRIGRFPEQGSHPGPLSFYLLAIPYRLLGSSSWALLTSSVVVNVAALSTSLALAFRRGGWSLTGATGVWLLVALRGYGVVVLTQPWNPYLPLVAWTVVVLACWMVLEGDHRMLVPMVVAGTLCAQTHVPYLVLCVGLFVLAVVVSCLRWRRGASTDGTSASLLWAVGIGVVLWLPPLVDQAIHQPGNIRMLERHFTNPTEDPIGVRNGLRLLLRHLDIGPALAGHWTGGFVQAAFSTTRSVIPGAVLLLAWCGAVLCAWRLRHRALLWLHATIAAALAAETMSMVRIFGKVWYYLTLWAWSITVLMAFATVATFAVVVRRRRGERARRTLVRGAVVGGALLAGVSLVALTASAAVAQPPEHHLSTSLGAVVGPTVQAVRDRVGAASAGMAGHYVVTWSDAYFFGSQGYGLVNELERRGVHVGVDATFRVPVTPQRVLQRASADAELHFATGKFVDEWAAKPGVVKVADIDPRSPSEHVEFDLLHAQVAADLHAAGLDDLVPTLDTNLFGVQLDPRVAPAVQRSIARMLDLGERTAVFIAPLP